MEIILYQNKAEKYRQNKTKYMTEVDVIAGTLREETSITNPIITIQAENINFNYIYILEFKRYYYVNNYTSIRNDLWEIECSVDVLMSYSEAIGNLTAFIDRNENEYNKYISDDKIVAEVGYTYSMIEFYNNILKESAFYVVSGFGIGME